jgi:hypothetical protein
MQIISIYIMNLKIPKQSDTKGFFFCSKFSPLGQHKKGVTTCPKYIFWKKRPSVAIF